jgi:DNA/RNA-binding domain of Phe-tRNA-synthetase-like protein
MDTAAVVDFQHSAEIWRDFPELVPGIVLADGMTDDVAAGDRVGRLSAIAKSRLTGVTESELPEIQAWRRAFTRMGLKPTQYRCASEALLRRLRKEGTLPGCSRQTPRPPAC